MNLDSWAKEVSLLILAPGMQCPCHLLCDISVGYIAKTCSYKAGSEVNEVAQSCPTLYDPMNYSLPGSSVHGIFQARVLELVAISSSKGSS